MPSTGFEFPGTATNIDTGSSGWVNVNNALTDDGNNATVNDSTEGSPTDYLRLHNFAFGIPYGAAINRIDLEIQGILHKVQGTETGQVKLCKTYPLFNNQTPSSVVFSTQDSLDTLTYSGAALWGFTWSSVDFGTDFGVIVVLSGFANGATLGIDYAKVSVDYSDLTHLGKRSGPGRIG